MTGLVRWLKFNGVGAMGMAVQLGVLAVLNRWMRGHYLLATGAAIELTLAHNFCWHVRFTWRDRGDGGSRVGQFVRFQMSNGVVSLIGNLLLMRVLVEGVKVPVVWANLAAIGCCSLLNFWLGDRWAFQPDPAALPREEGWRGPPGLRRAP